MRVLLLTLRELGCDVSEFRDLIRLNVYAVRFRYEPAEPLTSIIDRPVLLARVEDVYQTVSRVLNLLEAKEI